MLLVRRTNATAYPAATTLPVWMYRLPNAKVSVTFRCLTDSTYAKRAKNY
jgi:hypothetical protein